MSEDGRREVLIVYRARRDDWTFAKGKRRCDEVDAACARREVEEETGLRCVLGPELPPNDLPHTLRSSEAGPLLSDASDWRQSRAWERDRRRPVGGPGRGGHFLDVCPRSEAAHGVHALDPSSLRWAPKRSSTTDPVRKGPRRKNPSSLIGSQEGERSRPPTAGSRTLVPDGEGARQT